MRTTGTDKIYIRYQLYSDQYEIAIIQERDGKRYIGKIVFEEIKGFDVVAPTLAVDDSFLNGMKLELEREGFIKDSDSAPLKAVSKHLEDMRVIAFHKLGIKQ